MIQPRTTPKTIAIADPRWFGHHPTYFKEFTASLLRLGHRVIALCRQPEELEPAARATCDELEIDFATTICIAPLDDPGRAYMFPKRLDHDPLSTLVRWRCLRRALDNAESKSGWHADLVFFPWLDSYLRFQPSKSLPSLILGRPWAGLYFRNHHFETHGSKLISFAKGDRGLKSAHCRAVGVLDDRFSEHMRERSGQTIIPFPDITDETDPTELSPFAQQLIRQANGRKIIGMISLEQRKGFITMLRIAEAVAGREDWYFVAAGTYCPDTCSPEERSFVERIDRLANREGKLDNVHLQLPGERIADGAEYNSLIKSFDLIYAAYEGFRGSSNALTKAAVFEKPVLATRGECVGDRVEHFGLGLTIDEGDATAGESAIRQILAGTEIPQPRFDDYRSLHNRDQLDRVFAEIVATV